MENYLMMNKKTPHSPEERNGVYHYVVSCNAGSLINQPKPCLPIVILKYFRIEHLQLNPPVLLSPFGGRVVVLGH
jgi:hypothetical protein